MATHPYSVLLLRPDHIGEPCGQDTYFALVEANEPADAVKVAQTEAFNADYGWLQNEPGFVKEQYANDWQMYRPLLVIAGHHDALSPGG